LDEERLISLKEMESRLGYRFHTIEWLDQALTHKSFIHPSSKKGSNEVLEFLGDAVLNLVVSHLLVQKFPEAQEGTLSMLRSHLVKGSSLAFLSRKLEMEGYLLLGRSEVLNGGGKKSSILANAYEALIGAIYMDSGLDRALEIVHDHVETYLQFEPSSEFFSNYKSLLQEHAQRVHGKSPQYRMLIASGPDHDKRFQASVSFNGEVRGIGWGKSKKEAEQEAAKKALEEIQNINPK